MSLSRTVTRNPYRTAVKGPHLVRNGYHRPALIGKTSQWSPRLHHVVYCTRTRTRCRADLYRTCASGLSVQAGRWHFLAL